MVEVKLRPWRLPGGEDVCWQRIVVKTVESVMSTCQKVDAVCAGKAYKSGT